MTASHPTGSARYTEPVRFNPYRCMHKALRAMNGSTLLLLGRAAPADGPALTQALAQVRELLAFSDLCLELECEHLHGAVPATARASCAIWSDSEARLAESDRLRELCRVAEAAEPSIRERLVDGLYQHLARLATRHDVAMFTAESNINQLLWQAWSDEQLRRRERDMLVAVERRRLAWWLYWLVPALNPVERQRVLHATAAVSAEVLREVLAMLVDVLPKDEYWQLRASCGHGE